MRRSPQRQLVFDLVCEGLAMQKRRAHPLRALRGRGGLRGPVGMLIDDEAYSRSLEGLPPTDARIVKAVNDTLKLRLRHANNDGTFLLHLQATVEQDGNNIERMRERLAWTARYWALDPSAADKIKEWTP